MTNEPKRLRPPPQRWWIDPRIVVPARFLDSARVRPHGDEERDAEQVRLLEAALRLAA